MSKIYRVGSIYGTEYVNTLRAAARNKPGGEEPESVDRVDVATECNDLFRQIEETEKLYNVARQLLEDLADMCPTHILHETATGDRVRAFITAHPLPPADAADRDGQRSYGG